MPVLRQVELDARSVQTEEHSPADGLTERISVARWSGLNHDFEVSKSGAWRRPISKGAKGRRRIELASHTCEISISEHSRAPVQTPAAVRSHSHALLQS
jgi:hypothetical protein